MKTLTTYLLTLTLLALLVAGARVAQAQPGSAAPESAEARSSRLTRYLGKTLHLSRQQRKEVARSSRQYFQQLVSLGETPAQPGMLATTGAGRTLPSPAALQAGKEYDENLARVLTPGQYNAYCWLTRQPETGR